MQGMPRDICFSIIETKSVDRRDGGYFPANPREIVLLIVKYYGPNSPAYYDTMQRLGLFYNRFSESLPISEERILVHEKVELCIRKINENKSFFDASLHESRKNYTPQEITPCFPKNKTITI